MTTRRLIRKGDLCLDFYALTPEIVTFIVKNKVVGVWRYIGPGDGAKLVDEKPLPWDPAGRTETQLYGDLGVAFGGILERSSDDIDGGYKGGQEAGRRAVAGADRIGYPREFAVTCCADKDVTDLNAQLGAAYAKGFTEITKAAGAQVTSGYGDTEFFASFPFDITALAGAAIWSRGWFERRKAGLPWTFTPSMLQQLDKANKVDRLLVYKEFEMWVPPPSKPPRRILKFLMRGDDVKAVQVQLGVKPANGFFWVKTRAAVKGFQRKHGLVEDGIVGPLTWAALDKAAV